jgi:hypothetical protein
MWQTKLLVSLLLSPSTSTHSSWVTRGTTPNHRFKTGGTPIALRDLQWLYIRNSESRSNLELRAEARNLFL